MVRAELRERRKDVARRMAEPQPEHLWLEKFLGEWESKGEVAQGPKGPEDDWVERNGVETVRSLGGLWVVIEGKGSMLDAADVEYVMILGYDPIGARFVGTWTGSVMTHQWIYEGDLVDDNDELTLYADGPSMSRSPKAMYKDVITFTDDDHRVLRSYVQEGADQETKGEWRQFAEVHHRRRRPEG
jgi:hypothetical protein